MSNLPQVLSDYITQRTNLVNRSKSSIFTASGNPIFAFSEMIDAHATRVAAELPDVVSLAEWEALAELTASRLSYMRRIIQESN